MKDETHEAPPPTRSLDRAGLADLLTLQDGVVSRRQVFELGGTDGDIARMLRRKELVRVHAGVFVDHTGSPTWQQRSWAAVLVHSPAVLTRASALPSPSAGGPIHVAIDVRRTVRHVAGVVAHRTPGLDERADWAKSPPRMRVEHAALDVAGEMTDQPGRAFQHLATICQTRRTTAARLRAVLLSRRGLPHRALLLELLADLEAGACSVLEREYLRLEDAHSLPTAERQARDASDGRSVYRDVLYRAHGLVVELDGRAYHDDPASRDADAARDLDAVVISALQTVRLTHGQVFDDGCRTAASVGGLLRRLGRGDHRRPSLGR